MWYFKRRQIEKEEEASQDNIFPESRANLFTKFGQAEELREFHLKKKTKFIIYQILLIRHLKI